ncbi:MAG: aminopeptidase [Ignavibacterium sp.]|nr:MAG: aminopeptidase [Ignavibacterium sp.]
MKAILYNFKPIFVLIFFLPALFGQEKEEIDVHEFTILYNIETTLVKHQGKTGTCWTFATQSFLETELIRMGIGEYDLSEMYMVRNIYPIKAEKYIRYHGLTSFDQGGQAHDVLIAMDKYGLVPEEIYPGKSSADELHNHMEMVAVLKGSMDAIISTKGKISDNWKYVCGSVLDIYLGENSESFYYNGKEYTPRSFADELAINSDDYIEFTSYMRYPYYEQSILEVPDNWTNNEYYNIPIDNLIEVIDNAIKNGYSVVWDGDTSEKTFYRKKGYAVIPVDDEKDGDDKELTEPEREKVITQEMREKTFENFLTTDDHLMHIIGLAENQEGTKFYHTKNSWGTKYKYDGYWYMSEPFVRLKTIAIMVHKDAVPENIKAKLGI